MSNLSPNRSRKQLIGAIVGPSVGCGLFLGLALAVLDKHYPPTQHQLFSFALDVLLSGTAMYIAITSCKKVLKLLP